MIVLLLVCRKSSEPRTNRTRDYPPYLFIVQCIADSYAVTPMDGGGSLIQKNGDQIITMMI